MKTQKIIKITTIILLVVIMSIASFVGVYKLNKYKVTNIIPDYVLGMEFTESRVIDLQVDKTSETTIYDQDKNEVTEKQEGIEYTVENGYTIEETKINKDENLTEKNYKLSKKILKSRLKKLGVDQYQVDLDKTNGNLKIRIPEKENTDMVIYNLLQSGTFELRDSETEEILLDTIKVKKVDVVYGQTETETSVYLQIRFNKEGKQKLEEISKIYVETENETENENKETEENTSTKDVSLYLNGQFITKTHFGEPIVDGKLNVPFGSGNNAGEIKQYITAAEEAKAILDSGILPITYTETDYNEKSNITEQQINIAKYIVLGIVVLMLVVYVIGLKSKGILAFILQIGYIALLLLVLRYTNVKITIQGICGIIISFIINFVYMYKAFKNNDLDILKDITPKFALKLIPVYVLAIIFSFNSIANIYSLGMTLVWGIIVMYLYNLSLTQTTLKTIK